MRKITLFLLLTVLISACDKPNPEPETLDPVYSEIEKEAAKAEAEIKKAEKDLEGFEKDLAAVVPQTGQIKYAEKRVYETKSKIDQLNQMKTYWDLRLKSRKKWDRDQYTKAYNKKEKWPDPKDFEEYEIQRKLELAPRNWDNRQRLEQAKLGLPLKAGESGHGEGAPEKKEHGEH